MIMPNEMPLRFIKLRVNHGAEKAGVEVGMILKAVEGVSLEGKTYTEAMNILKKSRREAFP